MLLMESGESYLYSSNDLRTGYAKASLPKNITRKELKVETHEKSSFLCYGKTNYFRINIVIAMIRYF